MEILVFNCYNGYKKIILGPMINPIEDEPNKFLRACGSFIYHISGSRACLKNALEIVQATLFIL